VASRQWPNLFVVGVARGGTSSLAYYLGQHPDIYMSSVKEPYFFSRAYMRHLHFPKNEDAYLDLFEEAESARWRGEASSAYFWDEESGPWIKRASPEARIVISLRDPVARAYSGYWHAVRLAGEGRPFLEVIRSELDAAPEDERGPGVHAPGHVGAGHYADGVERYVRLFGDNLHILFFDELVADPRNEVRKIFDFLDIDAGVADEIEVGARNASVAPRNSVTRRLLGFRAVRAFGRAVVPQALHPRVESVFRKGRVPELEAEARELLEVTYSADQERLEALLGRQPPWRSARAASAD
jgi:hypothetical protein